MSFIIQIVQANQKTLQKESTSQIDKFNLLKHQVIKIFIEKNYNGKKMKSEYFLKFEKTSCINEESYNLKITSFSINHYIKSVLRSTELSLNIISQLCYMQKREWIKINTQNGEIKVGFNYMISKNLFDKFVKRENILNCFLNSNFENILNCWKQLNKVYQKFDNKNICKDQKHINSLQNIKNLYTIESKFEYQNADNFVYLNQFDQHYEERQINIQNLYVKRVQNNEVLSNSQYYFVNNIQEQEDSQGLKKRFLDICRQTLQKSKDTFKEQYDVEGIEDFLFNTISFQITQLSDKPFSNGGFCEIFFAKCRIVFIDSFNYLPYKIEKTFYDKFFAIKKLKKDSRSNLQKIFHQNDIIQHLKNKISTFLPKYYGVQPGKQYSDTVLMQYIDGVDLEAKLFLQKKTMSLRTRLLIIFRILSGLITLSNAQIVHLDIKPWNILVQKNYNIKLIDFGESYHQELCQTDYNPGFTFPFVAPQIIKRKVELRNDYINPEFKFSQKQDIFALGHILSEVIFKANIFQKQTPDLFKIYFHNQIDDYLFLAPERTEIYGEKWTMYYLLSLILRCIDENPERRPFIDWAGALIKEICEENFNE